MKTEFKQAGKDHLPVILSMMEDFYAIDTYPFNAALTEKNLKTFIDNPGLGRLWLISLQEKTIGYIVLSFGFSFEYGGRDAFIDEFYIHKDFRNKGIGKETLEYLCNKSMKLGVQSIHLEVENHNHIGNRLYLNQGFRSNNRTLLTKKL
jgi:ribosomal protein S18 acetylase RimI-like enzyme